MMLLIPYKLKYGIKNLVKWLPVIWKDRDWDYAYLYIIMHKKLSHMEEAFRSENAHVEDSFIIANEIKEVKDTLKRLIDDEVYYIESCRNHGAVPYDNDDLDDIGFCRDISLLENSLRNKDIRKVFSEEVSMKIRGWWD